MTPDENLKLNNITARVREHRASDFLSKEQIEEVHRSNAQGKKAPKFNQIDAYVAEILARFGYNAYIAWKSGEIEEKAMAKYIMAERAREAYERSKIEGVIIASQTQKGRKEAVKMLKQEIKLAKGGA